MSSIILTKSKFMEKELHSCRKILSAMANLARMGPWEYDDRTGLFEFNEDFYAVYGTSVAQEGRFMSPEEYVREFVHPSDARIVKEIIENSSPTQNPTCYEHRVIRRDGAVRIIRAHWGAISRDSAGNVLKRYGVNQDITEQVLAKNALEESEERLRILVESTAQAIWETDRESWVIKYSPTWRSYTGQSIDEVLGFGWANAIHPDDLVNVLSQWNEAVKTELCFNSEYRIRSPDGGWRWTNVRAAPIRNSDGKIAKWVGMNIDITDSKLAEEALHQSEELFEKAFNSSGAIAAIVKMSNDTFIKVNKACSDLVEYSEDEILGRSEVELNLYAEDMDRIQFLRETIIKNGHISNCVIKLRAKSGKIVTILASSTLANINGELYRINIGHDITTQKVLETEIQRFDRLNIVGEMAASIAHEIRNPMTTIKGYLQVFQQRDEFAKHKEQLATMIEEIDRANGIITEFLSLAKNKAVKMELGNINNIIGTLLPLIQADVYRTGHEIVVNLSDIPDTKFDCHEIRQLVLNLTRNSIEAMDAKGILTIKTYCNNDDVVLEIQDTGPGIPKDLAKELGKPFVTTKENGTGLGLPICYRIAERHNSELIIQSSSSGTSVSLILRRTNEL